MTAIIAAIDSSPAAQPVLETTRWLGELLGVGVRAIHLREDGSESVQGIAETACVPLSLLQGDPVEVITAEFGAENVLLGVMGTRGSPGGPRPGGHIALAVAQAVTKPLVLVPPERIGPDHGTPCRILAASDDTPESVAGVAQLLEIFGRADVDVVAVHVFESAKVPPFWDQAHHAAESWGREFLARHLHDGGARLELRAGAPGVCVVDVAEAETVDLIALSWSQDLGNGKAQTVQQVLTTSPVPVLLLPAPAAANAP